MLTVKVTTVGNSLGIVLPKEVLAHLRIVKGDLLYVLETPEGIELSPYAPDLQGKLETITEAVHDERDLLRQLARRNG